ncbi:Ig-like domain-containing protein [Planktothrix sp. FACHB-1375]|uniref:Ig-like domain-containing protein n=1 Tax=Aerosakkonema funiforme FACHB-1375 TaxID=2949571 RepID=A0A926VKM3_9CYAN|nr:Ig-like domain-containing protein [Aerosakkonema funiforme FACHB-1375]
MLSPLQVIKKVSDNSVVETIAVTSTNVTVSGSQLTINPTADLAQSTDYYVEITNWSLDYRTWGAIV